MGGPRIFYNPELKGIIEQLIIKVVEMSKTGSGELPICDVVNLFPGITDDILKDIKKRGVLTFKSSANRETKLLNFYNNGEEMEFDIEVDGSGYDLEIPGSLVGMVYIEPAGFKLLFTEDHTIRVGKWFFHIDLLSVEVDKNAIIIDFDGDRADLTIYLREAPKP